MDLTRQSVDEAGVPPARRSAFTVLVAAVVVLTAVAIVGCGPRHSSGGIPPTPTSSTTYAEGEAILCPRFLRQRQRHRPQRPAASAVQ